MQETQYPEDMSLRHEHSETIAAQNDAFRKHVLRAPHSNGICYLTAGFNALEDFTQFRIQEIIRAKETFDDPGNDPYGEHDFGSVQLPDVPKVFWKIDYYADRNMQHGTATPQAPTTFRVLSIMLAEEY